MNALRAGDKVGIASPAGFIRGEEEIRLPLEYLKKLGFECIIGSAVYKQERFMAGSDKERAADIMNFFADPAVKAIFTTAGGAGSQRILDLLDYDIIRKNPKPVIGLSDNTSLQNGIFARTGNESYTGFSLKYDFKNGYLDELTDNSLQKILKGEKQIITDGKKIIGGKTEGTLIGGCLSTFRNLMGTPYFPSLKDSIILIEDVGEKVHKIDLMLTQLRQQPDFGGIKGFIFGRFVNCMPSDPEDGSVEEAIRDFCSHIDIPVIADFRYGHLCGRYVLSIGRKVKLDANKCTLEDIV